MTMKLDDRMEVAIGWRSNGPYGFVFTGAMKRGSVRMMVFNGCCAKRINGCTIGHPAIRLNYPLRAFHPLRQPTP